MREETTDAGVLEHWTPEEVAAALKAGEIVLIDVRTPQEYMFEHIEGALLMPMAFFAPASLPVDGSKRVVLHCGSGMRSAKMAGVAAQAGIARMAHMEGGFGAWKAAKLPYIGTDMASGAPKRMGG
ncbi:rhodanese-like domain-containing protein [Albimonas sp. CAU 1670]|uniref:rhodanese-like domain-containing protein n=1 Tax=Albimonas sp. CAU 1670 TaxID=3032599 RepID=UPI0023DB9082|nr:rhodanese-like domain-containing protein [Albimonas sp. CAU 1670]MDF2232600.1 rhodanese-like domain-containing protein [Albimonas sp. CAU 1670]